jgi:glycerophosphoryl diester phosphodiesterase
VSRFFAQPPPRRFGHRGASGTHPENTLVSFRAALEKGAGALELDVHRTADGAVVVFHDDTLERTTDGGGPIRERTLRELQALDAGYRFSPDGGGTFPFRGSGVAIPTLAEVCEAFPKVPLIIEIKQLDPPLEEDLAQVLQSTGADSRALVFSLHQEPVDRFRGLGGSWPTGFGPGDVSQFLQRLQADRWDGYEPPGAAFAVPRQWQSTVIVSPPFVEAAHRLGCEVFVWTVNEPGEMHTLLDMGIDGLITDFPERLSRVLEERGDAPHAGDGT